MPAKISIVLPWPFAAACGNQTALAIEAETVLDALRALAAMHPDAGRLLLDEGGSPTGQIGLYLNKRDIRLLDGVQTALKDGDEILILPALSGG